jgi:hypothetical protein
VYFPTDNFSCNVSNDLCDTIDALETFIYSLNDVDLVLIGGDMNTDFSRNNAQSSYVKDFCERINGNTSLARKSIARKPLARAY